MSKFIYTTLAIVLVSGCSSLEQSALVYTSTINLGASVEVDVQGTGFDATLGYEQNDLAFVPVAVSEEDSKTDTKNIDASYGSWEIISAISYDTGSSSSTTTSSSNSSHTTPSDNKNTSSESQEDIAKANSTEELEEKQTEILSEISDLKEKISSVEAGEDKLELENQLAEKRQQLIKTQSNSVNEQPTKELHDAYSVYGSFDSNLTGSSSDATANLGRVFSTGVAAQKIAESLQISAKASLSNAVTNCINKLHEALTSETAAKADIPHNIYNICGTLTDKQIAKK